MVRSDSRFRVVMKNYRLWAGITLTELAQRTGIALPNISQLENGIYEPSWQAVRSIRQVLRIPAEECFGPPVPGLEPVPFLVKRLVSAVRDRKKKKPVVE